MPICIGSRKADYHESDKVLACEIFLRYFTKISIGIMEMTLKIVCRRNHTNTGKIYDLFKATGSREKMSELSDWLTNKKLINAYKTVLDFESPEVWSCWIFENPQDAAFFCIAWEPYFLVDEPDTFCHENDILVASEEFPSVFPKWQ